MTRSEEDLDMRRDDEMEVDDADDPNVKRKGRGFNIRGGADVQMDGVKAKTFDRLDGEEDGGAKAARSVEGWILIVTNIHEEATEEDVLDKFADFGEVKNCHLNLDRRTGYVKGYALLEFPSHSEAKEAIEACQDGAVTLMEQQLSADFAFVRPPPSGPAAGGQRRGGGGGGRRDRDRDVRERSPGRR
ncbi:RNA-binding domain-containing protein [Microstroma glucosiphilum]|uniref:RNA-binding domain-containing protein n=1 Tax=Pseudomicrostroma glucosiphilum TaxID=1684307 RepID=A0A316U643_9BASI|nr:RNA-binding domain-containing protein [Pseudomicrostroma glucosiphilum]PWN20298.1 RNA-binding domain-containing protein [Pseudomicrostroma glucosiphilum]